VWAKKERSLRKSNKEAAQTREAIVAAAADHIRRTGIVGASLADVMAAAGLTQGGFYRHFRNKEHLVAEAFSAAGDKTVATISRTMSKGGVNAAIDDYLSTSHRDAPTPICPLAALGSEVARSGSEAKVAATEVLEKLLVALADKQSGPEARGDAIIALATMIGAMTIARMVSDTALSDEILNRVRDHLHR
jgi:TetR/AcrR family transcriptional regulator, transcriptional repressor for nem operon